MHKLRSAAIKTIIRLGSILGMGLTYSFGLALLLNACAGPQPSEQSSVKATTNQNSEAATAAPNIESSNLGNKLLEPGELDKLLDEKPIALAAVKTTLHSGSGAQAKLSEPVSTGRGKFRIQIGAESDMDAAQSKKGTYEKQLGGTVDIVFDAPYYKLRWGYFESKQDAEDKLLELSDQKIQGFVVK
jgi:SPOR domain